MSDTTPVIDRYSRAQAIEDGVLIDVTSCPHAALVREAGIGVPFAITANAYEKAVALDQDAALEGDTEPRRLRRLLERAVRAFRRAPPEESFVTFKVEVIRNGCTTEKVRLWAIMDGGDDGAPAMTVMLPEDY